METESEPYVRLASLRQLHLVVAELSTARSLADTLQTTVPAVKSRLHRARLALRAELSNYFDAKESA